MGDERFTLWRCATCRKWSHAKRQPATHYRWVRPGEPEYRPELDDTNPNEPEGHYVICGPFERWEARRVDAGG